MLHIRQLLVAFVLPLVSLGCTPIGCSGEDPELDKSADEQFVGAVEQQLPAPGTSSLYGTWIGPKMAGHVDMLVLMTNGLYHTAESVVCVKEPCDPITRDGAFKLYARDKRTYVELQLKGAEPIRYEYVASNDNLRLRPLVAGSEWFAMDPSGTAWCATARECNYQNLPTGVCAGGYECEKSICAWKCPRGGETSVAADKDTAGAVNPGDGTTP